MEGEVKGKTFKMKGHTLPGINQRLDATATNVAEQGLAGSSAFQQDPLLGPMAGASGIAETVQKTALGRGGSGGFGSVGLLGLGGVGQGSTFPSKPSMAKIYDKPKGKRTEY